MNGVQDYNNDIKKRTENYLSNKCGNYEKILRGYLNWMGTDKSLNTKHQYIKICYRFLDYTGVRVESLNVDDYAEFFNLFNDKASSYRVMVYSALSGFSDYLYDTEKNPNNSMNKIKAPKKIESQETIEKREKGFLNEDDIKKYLTNVKNGVGNEKARLIQEKWRPRDIFLTSLMLTTGARVSAVSKMDVADIKYEEEGVYIITTEKRGKVRKYFLSDDLRMLMEEYLYFRDEILDGIEIDALFISDKKERLSTTSMRNIVKKYGEGIKNISPHKLRATFGTQLYKQTHDIFFVQQSMGHSNAGTTSLYVRGEGEEIQKKSVEAMSKLVFE